METFSCVLCGANKIFNKKRSLCYKCYSKQYRENKLPPPVDTEEVSQHKKEREFIKNYFGGRINWVYEPASFIVQGYGKYIPDFYDQSTGYFIEVAGTRQAFDYNREKYIAFNLTYPSILFEVRTSKGDIVDFKLERQPPLTWNYNIN
jgi:hypothetical protein